MAHKKRPRKFTERLSLHVSVTMKEGLAAETEARECTEGSLVRQIVAEWLLKAKRRR